MLNDRVSAWVPLAESAPGEGGTISAPLWHFSRYAAIQGPTGELEVVGEASLEKSTAQPETCESLTYDWKSDKNADVASYESDDPTKCPGFTDPTTPSGYTLVGGDEMIDGVLVGYWGDDSLGPDVIVDISTHFLTARIGGVDYLHDHIKVWFFHKEKEEKEKKDEGSTPVPVKGTSKLSEEEKERYRNQFIWIEFEMKKIVVLNVDLVKGNSASWSWWLDNKDSRSGWIILGEGYFTEGSNRSNVIRPEEPDIWRDIGGKKAGFEIGIHSTVSDEDGTFGMEEWVRRRYNEKNCEGTHIEVSENGTFEYEYEIRTVPPPENAVYVDEVGNWFP